MMPRRLGPGDLDALDALKPDDWPPYRSVFERYFTLPFVAVYGADAEGELATTGTLIALGPSGWVAQVITAPKFRGQGLATGLLAFLLGETQRLGWRTVSLVATDQGYPLYAQAGFRVEGEYVFWSRSDPAPALPEASAGLKPWSADVGRLDRAASGEDRQPLWRDLTSDALTAEDAGGTGGLFVPRLGDGLVVARSQRAGVPLLHRRLDGAQRCVLPAENRFADAVLASRGFEPVRTARRMVLGDALRRRPGWVWSRIGGNLG